MLRLRVTYGRTADFLMDVEQQISRRGLLVRVDVGVVDRGAKVKLDIVTPAGRVIVEARVLQPMGTAGVAVELDPDALGTLIGWAKLGPAIEGPAPRHERLPDEATATPARDAILPPTEPPRVMRQTRDAIEPLARATRDTPTRESVIEPQVARSTREIVPIAPSVETRRAGTPPPITPMPMGTLPPIRRAGTVPPVEPAEPAEPDDAELAPPEVESAGGELADDVPLDDDLDEPTRERDPRKLDTATQAQEQAKKIQLALHGDKNQRMAILREPNKQLHGYVLRNPGLQLDEIIFIAKMSTASIEILTQIGGRREWAERPDVALALVRNPKTPVPLAIKMLDHVGENDLRTLAKQQSVRDAIQRAARKKILG